MALLFCGALFVGLHPPHPLEAGQAPESNVTFSALDLLVPIITLGSRAPSRHAAAGNGRPTS
ncbi:MULTISPECIES: hypothetical protein [Streptomyces]|uniref:hypothetical protein n=1 Tax=Streptomyces TaxID=1883 RepID=UPI001E2EC82B|nr:MULTISPECIES: hypothetical protein [Streptomyces]